MENRRYVKFWFCALGMIMFIIPIFVLAYSDTTTHPALTDETVDLFNYYYPDKVLDDAQKELLKKGSKEEDKPPRWLQHFYDPVYNKGLVFVKEWQKSKEWSRDILAQAKYDPVFTASLGNITQKLFSSEADYSWERAVYEYAWGDKKRAMESLGHVLHLLQDATVPAHARNDIHLPFPDMGSPYEDWAKQFDAQNFSISDKLTEEGKTPDTFSNLGECFDNNAFYSNNNFFSKDTIFIEKYELPVSIFERTEKLNNGKEAVFGYGRNNESLEFKLVGRLVSFEWQQKIQQEYFIKDPDNLILKDYWNILSERAVLSGAGAIKLFFDEVEKEKQTKELLSKNKSFFGKIFSKIADIFRESKEIEIPTGGNLALLNQEAPLFQDAGGAIEEAASEPAPEPITPSTSDVDGNGMEPAPGEMNEVESRLLEPALEPAAEFPASTPVVDAVPQPKFISSLIAIPPGAGGGALPVSSEMTSDVVSLPEPEDTTSPDSPIIISPTQEEMNQTFTTNQISFIGAAEALSTISQNYSGATTTADADGSWSFDFVLGQGATTVQFFAEDEAGNISSSTEAAVFIDSIAPDTPVLQVLECDDSLVTNGCLLATATLNISWLSSAEDLDFYEITIDNQASATTATSTIVLVDDNSINVFSVKAKDLSGNYSGSETMSVEISTNPVVINEVAWAGTSSSYPNDEWIELYNKTSAAINLDGWVLYSQTDNGPYINLSGQILANGYYLIERTDDDAVSDILADWKGSFVNELSNGGEILVLTKASTTGSTGSPQAIDQTVLCGSGYYKWCPGFDYKYRTMERVDPNIAGTDASNWSYNDQVIKNGLDADGVSINGTPKARNSKNYYIVPLGSSISSDKILTKSSSPYFVNNTAVSVSAGATLTIEPGVVVKFYNDAGLGVLGKIIAQGTEAEPVVFTSFYDDEYGGDLNNDATTTSPYPGSWFGVTVNDSAQNGSVFENTIFRYGGKYYNGQTQSRALLATNGPAITVSNSVFEYSKVYGLKLANSNSLITNNIFRNNNSTNDLAGINSALYAAGGNATVQNNIFQENNRGIYLSGSKSTVSSNTFTLNTGEAIYSLGVLGSFTNNFGSNNAVNAIKISGNLTDADNSYSLLSNGLPYFLGDTNPTVAVSSTLTIEKNVVVKGNTPLRVDGNLVINGENPENIIFTSLYDDSVSGDTTNDGTSTPQAGQFKGIAVSETGSLNARGFTMRYAGSVGYMGNEAAGLTLNGASAVILDALFSNNYPYGIRAVNSENVRVENARFENHNYSIPEWGTKAALSIHNSTTTLANITFENNALGILSDTLSNFTASLITWLNNLATTSPGGLF